MKHVWICLCLMAAGFLLFAGNASAEDERWGFQRGDRELTLAGTGSSDNNFDSTNLSAQVGLGYFMTDFFEIAFRQDGTYIDRKNGGSYYNAASRGALDFYMPLDPVYPYIGVNGGYIYGDLVNDQWIVGPEAGIKFFAGPTSFIYGALEYEFLLNDSNDVEEDFEDGRFVYSIGVGLTF